MKKSVTKVALSIKVELQEKAGNGEYTHIVGTVVPLDDDAKLVMRLNDGPYNGGVHRVNGLKITAQAENDRRERGFYAYSVEYDLGACVTRDVARAAYETLDYIEKRLAKIAAVRGFPRTVGEYVGRVAEVIGATEIRSDSVTLGLGNGVSLIEGWEREFTKAAAVSA